MKRMFKKIKNFVLWSLFYINFISLILSVCCMDSDYYIMFSGIIILNILYLSLFMFVNYDKIERKLEKRV